MKPERLRKWSGSENLWAMLLPAAIATAVSVGVAAVVIGVGCAVAPITGAVIVGAAIGGISETVSQIATEGKVTSVKK